MAEELDERLADENALRHIHRVVVLVDLVWAGAQGVQVCRDARGLLELVNGHIGRVFIEVEEPFDASSFKNVPSAVLLVPQVIPALDGVGNSPPFRWAQDDQAHLGLEVGLIKAGEDSEAVERLEL